MSLEGKTRICLLVFFCVAGLTAAFNSERKSSGDVSIHPHNGQHEETKDAHLVPATHQETTQKRNTRIKRARQRHERNRREKEDEDAMREVFSDPNSIPNTFGYNSNLNSPSASGGFSNNAFSSNSNGYSSSSNGYNYEPPQQQLLLPQPMYFQSPQSYAGPQYLPSAPPSHNTIIPNGNQVNNFYTSRFPTYPPASNPWSGVPNNFPAPFFYGPFLIIPIPICYPNNVANNNVNNQPAPPPETNVSLDNRIGLNSSNDKDDNEIDTGRPLLGRPPFDFNKYYNTSTGVDLSPVAPSRPGRPSVRPPPALHISGGNVNSQAGQAGPPGQAGQQVPPQQSRPQRPLQTTTTRSPLRTTTRRSMQQSPARPRPIPQRPPVSRPYPQRPPLRPVVEEPPQELDGPGSQPSQGDNCVWAIVRCCNQVPRPVSVPRCFELLGCPGAFFDNPCESDTAMSIARLANEIQQNGQGLLFS